MMKTKSFVLSFFVVTLMATGCKRNPTGRLVDPTSDGAAPQTSGTYFIYEDEFKTGGGLGFVPNSGNQSIEILDNTSPRRSKAHIRYIWNGGDVVGNDGNLQHLFAGFSLLVSENFSTLAATSAKDLSGPGYTTLTFSLRGSLGTGNSLRIEGPTDGSSGATPARVELTASEVSSTWTDVSLTIPAGDFSSVKVFCTFTIQFEQPPRTTNPGSGGVIFLDDIRYVQ